MSSVRSLHLSPPFRAEHVGSFLRPAALSKKRELFENHKCTLEELRAAGDEAIKRIVKMQKDVGIKTITDGELRRYTAVRTRKQRC
jgi:methionine synthase II (cobalamin-independent)